MKRSTISWKKEVKILLLYSIHLLSTVPNISGIFQFARVQISCNTRTYLIFYAKKLLKFASYSLNCSHWLALFYLRLIIKIICRERIYYKWHNNHKNKTDSHTRCCACLILFVQNDIIVERIAYSAPFTILQTHICHINWKKKTKNWRLQTERAISITNTYHTHTLQMKPKIYKMFDFFSWCMVYSVFRVHFGKLMAI